MVENLYSKISAKRKKQQANGELPEWYTSSGLQMFEEKYMTDATTVREQFERIARTAAHHTTASTVAYDKFFNLLWMGWLSPSTPVLANMGTTRGLPVSCSGAYIDDSIDGFYTARRETALLTKYGFGTSGYLGDIRPRGTPISIGGKASGVLPVFQGFIRDMRDVAQGTTRRGAWAGYLPIQHGDFDELADFVLNEPDDANIGWVISDEFIARLDTGDEDAKRRYQKALKLKMVTGKGYFFFVDKANEARPDCYKKLGLDIKASNLCSEIMLHSSKEYSFTCVLSSMNLAKYNEWKNTDAVFWATVFLDCVAQEFIKRAEGIPGLEGAVEFTRKGRALGLGVCGFHTYLQQEGIPFESLDAHYANNEIFSYLRNEADKASKWLAGFYQESEWCRGTGRANTHLLAIAPTKSTAVIMGGVSEGINPDPAMVYTQSTSAGEVQRVNPTLLKIMKEKGLYNKKTIQDITDNFGSVQHVYWLDDKEKAVFKTAFEINQEVVLRLASHRQVYLDQAQSINLFFSSDEKEEWISHIHKLAFKDPRILSLYYIYSKAGVHGSRECEACQ